MEDCAKCQAADSVKQTLSQIMASQTIEEAQGLAQQALSTLEGADAQKAQEEGMPQEGGDLRSQLSQAMPEEGGM